MVAIPADKLTFEELTALMSWYADMGVDLAIDGEPHDRFAANVQPAGAAAAGAAPPGPQPRIVPTGRPAAVAVSAPPTPETAAMAARDLAAAARTLDELRAAIEAFDGCALKKTAQRTVFADGDPRARLMLVGEAPGADEDRQGLPFVGRAGQLLDRMLAAIELDRRQVYIANIVPWRPPGNRAPSTVETAICLPFIQRQIELCDPALLICLGGSAMQALLGVKDGIMRTRGRWFDYTLGHSGRQIRAMATLHPAYLLRSPSHKRLAWRDLLTIAKALGEIRD